MIVQTLLWVLLPAVWAGVSLAGNLVAAPAKFRVEALSLPVALQVGRAQFAWIGRVEWALLAAVLLTVLLDFRMPPILLEVAGVIFLAQQFWLQPMLRTRSNLIIAGQDGQGGRLHLIFTLLELVKFLSLLAAATTSLWELIK